MLHVSMVGCGAIGQGVLELLKSDPDVCFDAVIVPEHAMDKAREAIAPFAPNARVTTHLSADAHPDLLVECAGHDALEEHVLPALEQGIDCLVVSVGALSEPGVAERLEAAARRGNAQVRETEKLVALTLKPFELKSLKQKGAHQGGRDVARLEEELADQLGLGVQIKLAAKGRGQLTVQFSSLDEFDGLLARLRPDGGEEAA